MLKFQRFLLLILLFSILPFIAVARLEPIDFSAGPTRTAFDNLAAKLSSQRPSTLLAKERESADPFLGVTYHSGYIHVGEEKGEMFYWYFPSELNPDELGVETPFIIWLTGGPGCSSELAALAENGPLSIQLNGTVVKNPWSWHVSADVVYIDQPLGTGFSCVGDPRNYVVNEKMVAKDMREFLVQFIEQYPTLKNKPFFITGESYAGHYIPSVAHLLLKEPIEDLNLQGIAIGNGWVDPRAQYPAYADFALEHGMVGEVAYELAKEGLRNCVELIDQGIWILAIVQCNAIVSGLLGKKNPYDVRLDCEIPPMCYNTTGLDTFMNREDVQKALGVRKAWKECNLLVYALMLGDWITDVRSKVGELLEAGKRVLIYSGDQDFICNWRGGEAWVNNIEWEKQEEFEATPYSDWRYGYGGGEAVGAMKKVDNLTFLRVFDAGHMVPMDKPEIAVAMISSFLANRLTPSIDRDNVPQATDSSSLFDVKSMFLAVS